MTCIGKRILLHKTILKHNIVVLMNLMKWNII